jgi:hypothetical protein
MASKNLSTIEIFLKEFGNGSLDAAFSMLTDHAHWSIMQTVRGTTMTMSELRSRLEGMRASIFLRCRTARSRTLKSIMIHVMQVPLPAGAHVMSRAS